MNLQEYERTVIFRLGRLLSGGARGPGVFFIIPCVDVYEKIDLRVRNFNVPPQEVRTSIIPSAKCIFYSEYKQSLIYSTYSTHRTNLLHTTYFKFPLIYQTLEIQICKFYIG